MVKLQIEVNGEQLDYVKDTLSIKEILDTFQESYQLPATTYPFLIIDNEVAQRNLGVFKLGTSLLDREVSCLLRFRESVFKAIITQEDSLDTGYRKCNLRIVGDLDQILSRPLKDFMPVIKLDPNAGDYSEDYNGDYDQSVWITHVASVNNRTWPQVKYVFPQIKHLDREDDELNSYLGFLNLKDNNGVLELNEFTEIDPFNATLLNKSRLAPKVFILTVLENVFSSIGWRIKGSFVDHPAIRTAFFDVDVYQTFTDLITSTGINIDFTPLNYSIRLGGQSAYRGIFMYVKEIVFTLPDEDDYILKYNIEMPDTLSGTSARFSQWGLAVIQSGTTTDSFLQYVGGTQTGELSFSGVTGEDVKLLLFSYNQIEPDFIDTKILKSTDAPNFQPYHPTLDLGRYVPEWRVNDLFKNLRQLFNLKFDANEASKTMSISFRKDLINYNDISKLDLNVKMSNPRYSDASSFLLKMNEEDLPSLFIDKSGTILNGTESDQTKIIQSDFKVIQKQPVVYTNEYLDYRGNGIAFYDPILDIIGTQSFALSLLLTGENGIYNRLWKTWLRSRLNAFTVDIENYMTLDEIEKLRRSSKISIDDQLLLVKEIETKNRNSGSFEVKALLESIAF